MLDLMPLTRAMMNPFYDMDRMSRNAWGSFRTDIRETEQGYALEAELPGFRKEDISVEIHGDRLTIQAQRKEENEQKDGAYLRRERSFGSFSRSFDISQIQEDAITASYVDGILTLELPRKTAVTPTTRTLEIQ